MCYGFVVPLPQGEDTTLETFEDSRVRHMINDLLREDISVYWSETDFSALSKTLNTHGYVQEILHKKGAFVIPFSGDLYKDAMLVSIIYDYNQTHELDNQSLIKNEAHMLMEKLNFQGYELIEPKIAQHLGDAIRYGWPCYLQMADAGGFLTFEFLLDDETHIRLNNKDFNVFMWPYLPVPASYLEQFKSLSNIRGVNSIRRFVRNGGGYIGSCYGAVVGSSGILEPLIPFSLLRAYTPNLPIFVPHMSLSISDSLIGIKGLNEKPIRFTAEIIDTDNPVSYGLKKTMEGFFGQWFRWQGKNTDAIAICKDIKNVNEYSKSRNVVIGKPVRIYSTFGRGKTILFGDHPEFINNISLLFKKNEWNEDPYYGRRVVHNALFYATSKENIDVITSEWYEPSLIEFFKEKTSDLPINITSGPKFNSIKQRIIRFSYTLSQLNNISFELKDLFLPLENKSDVFAKGARFLGYTIEYCKIFREYNDKAVITIDKLEHVIPMLLKFDNSIVELVDDVKTDISWRLNKSEKLVSKILNIAENLKETLLSPKISMFQKIKLLSERRNLLKTFETGLKYIPQIYFETLKLARYCWYHYEANTAISEF
jgi:hypothetical protein